MYINALHYAFPAATPRWEVFPGWDGWEGQQKKKVRFVVKTIITRKLVS